MGLVLVIIALGITVHTGFVLVVRQLRRIADALEKRP